MSCRSRVLGSFVGVVSSSSDGMGEGRGVMYMCVVLCCVVWCCDVLDVLFAGLCCFSLSLSLSLSLCVVLLFVCLFVLCLFVCLFVCSLLFVVS